MTNHESDERLDLYTHTHRHTYTHTRAHAHTHTRTHTHTHTHIHLHFGPISLYKSHVTRMNDLAIINMSCPAVAPLSFHMTLSFRMTLSFHMTLSVHLSYHAGKYIESHATRKANTSNHTQHGWITESRLLLLWWLLAMYLCEWVLCLYVCMMYVGCMFVTWHVCMYVCFFACMYVGHTHVLCIHWCCCYYSIKNSLVALLEAR